MFLKKTLLSAISLVSFFTYPCESRIDHRAFKDVTKHFKKEYQAYSPTYGAIALNTGIMENMRFYGHYNHGDNEKDGSRLYRKDNSKDAMWSLIHALFPSNNGMFGTVADSAGNIASFIKTHPHSVANFITFCHDLYENKKNSSAKITNKQLKIKKNLENEEFIKLFSKDKEKGEIKGIKDITAGLFGLIGKAVDLEEQGLYPKYFVMQVLMAFFVKPLIHQRIYGPL
jgi:hypothetical protein